MTGGLVTIGETMALFNQPGVGKLRHMSNLTMGIGGAESNVAIGVARLGLPAAWIGRVGADELGELVLARIRAECVDVSAALRDPGVATSLMIKERPLPGVVRVSYYRRGGPGSLLRPSDVDESLVRQAQVLHVSGITPALSRSALETVRASIGLAQDSGVAVSMDVNYRAALWSAEEAAPVLRDLVRRCDVVFAGGDEAELLGVSGEPHEQARGLAGLGPAEAVVKLGARGAVACVGGVSHTVAPVPVEAVDAVGAGDAFVAGYLAERMLGKPPEERLRTAAACGAFAVSVPGDWEGFPSRAELDLLTTNQGAVLR
ncbi:sugar kinase [Amycolatopsis acidiphila]|uniref:Sugar kinase n=1 Tax=Amycolatopsis acidiphila TaxID=715473 RepID=A0A558AL59_9PSEU|nr:sugar kinase [Amycolatopsis acidiphila]TVT25002.1 sugar kinase [Amycolatopsis acidiphila]UIJ57491.1 sugar kinase [Amycolatopsis acidiphila]GHG96396.1 sugar kinase [Amycolatopsis acidiphila]